MPCSVSPLFEIGVGAGSAVDVVLALRSPLLFSSYAQVYISPTHGIWNAMLGPLTELVLGFRCHFCRRGSVLTTILAAWAFIVAAAMAAVAFSALSIVFGLSLGLRTDTTDSYVRRLIYFSLD